LGLEASHYEEEASAKARNSERKIKAGYQEIEKSQFGGNPEPERKTKLLK